MSELLIEKMTVFRGKSVERVRLIGGGGGGRMLMGCYGDDGCWVGVNGRLIIEQRKVLIVDCLTVLLPRAAWS